MRTIPVCCFVLFFVLAGCSDDREALEQRGRELANELESKERFIDEMTTAISEVQEELESVWARQRGVLRQISEKEGKKGFAYPESKQRVLERISEISSILVSNRERLGALQQKLANARLEYGAFNRIVRDLKQELEKREKVSARMKERIRILEGEVSEKGRIIAARDVIIENQQKEMEKALFVTGSREELTRKGIIAEEGGILWGLFGSTTVLAASFDRVEFEAVDKRFETTIEIPGRIEEIVPKRDKGSYKEEIMPDGHTLLTIINPETFWRQIHLVVISGRSS